MKPASLKPKQSGFTIIELLIATVIFSVVMLVMLAAFIRTGDLFYKGISMMKTQEDSRNIVQSISDDIKFTKNPPSNVSATISAPGPGIFCIGAHRYIYQIGHQITGAPGDYAIKRDTISFSSGCNNALPGTSSEELLDYGMQLNALTINCSGGRCLVNTHVVFYGGSSPNQLFSSPTNITPTNTAKDAECTGSLSDTQLCATADFDSTVLENI
jgi:prepilin-type N-terminal cleavage/methylation domain-containing protein